MSKDTVTPPFGTFRLSPGVQALRRVVVGRSRRRLNRLLASAIRRLSLIGRPDPVDVEVFPGVKGRIYPRSNRCEKVIFTGSQFWDQEELAAVGAAITRVHPDGRFVFVDVGANIGLYSLYVCQAARLQNKVTTIVAIEPDPVNRERLLANLAINDFGSVQVSPLAAGESAGTATLIGGERNRGERRISRVADGPVRVETLSNILKDFALDRIDAMKIDIEGSDCEVANRFFSEAPPQLWPGLLIIELEHGENTGIADLCNSFGYQVQKRTRLNAILARDS